MSGNGLIGGNIAQLEQLHTHFKGQSQAVDDLMANLSNHIHSTWWHGGVADRFRSDWESEYRPALQKLSQALHDAHVHIQGRTQALVDVGA
ncbi:MAG: WXG100 family type VII secretion target [Acidimicrobiales bacterium]|nr:WXG100 family type VII secretion target [Acidimicrobiales bacterium]